MNGKEGVIVALKNNDGRFGVELLDDSGNKISKLIKEENLQTVESSASASLGGA